MRASRVRERDVVRCVVGCVVGCVVLASVCAKCTCFAYTVNLNIVGGNLSKSRHLSAILVKAR